LGHFSKMDIFKMSNFGKSRTKFFRRFRRFWGPTWWEPRGWGVLMGAFTIQDHWIPMKTVHNYYYLVRNFRNLHSRHCKGHYVKLYCGEKAL